MFRDILSSRGIIFGLVFFVLIVSGALLYSWHIRRTSAAEMAQTNQSLQKLRNKKETRTTQDTSVPTDAELLKHTETSMEIDDTVPQMSEETEVLPVLYDLADAFLPNDTQVEDEEESADVPVSPHGFGAYPEVPVDYPKAMTPTWIKYNGQQSRDFELQDRVLIKLWNQGDHDVGGAFMANGLVYPLYPNTAYVTYDSTEMPDGTVRRFIRSASGPLGTTPIIPARGGPPVLPEGVTALDMDNAGINPYDFLDLR